MDDDYSSKKLDLISDLPCEIFKHIISFLPLKEAVRSSTGLSSQWRQLLAPLPVTLEPLSDHTKGLDSVHVQQVLGGFLSSYVSHERCKFSFHAPWTKERCLVTEDVSLVVVATKGADKVLHLHFLKKSRKKETFGHGFHLRMQQSGHGLNNVHVHPSFSSLKILHLRLVNHHVMGLVMDLFACFRCLERLSLEKCNGLGAIHVEVMYTLQSLTLLDCDEIVSVKCSAPSLKSFWYCGVLPSIQLEFTSGLVEVNLDLKYSIGGYEFDCEDVLCLLDSLKEIQILTISGWLLEV